MNESLRGITTAKTKKTTQATKSKAKKATEEKSSFGLRL